MALPPLPLESYNLRGCRPTVPEGGVKKLSCGANKYYLFISGHTLFHAIAAQNLREFDKAVE